MLNAAECLIDCPSQRVAHFPAHGESLPEIRAAYVSVRVYESPQNIKARHGPLRLRVNRIFTEVACSGHSKCRQPTATRSITTETLLQWSESKAFTRYRQHRSDTVSSPVDTGCGNHSKAVFSVQPERQMATCIWSRGQRAAGSHCSSHPDRPLKGVSPTHVIIVG